MRWVAWLALATTALPAAAQPAPDAGVHKGKIEVAGASGDATAAPLALAVTAPGEAFEYRLRLEEVGGEAVDKLELSITPLIDDRGHQHTLTWGLDGQTASQHDRAIVAQPATASTVYMAVLRASLPEFGTYRATITPFWEGAPHQKIALTVTRASWPALNLDVPDPDPIVQTGDLDKVAFWASIDATENRRLSLRTPFLRSLTEVRGTDPGVKKYAAVGMLTVKDGDTKLDPTAQIELAPRASKRLGFELSNLPGPGHYDAVIRFASFDAPPIDKTFSIYLRESGGLAFLCIFVGVALSWFLRWFVLNERPRVANQQVVLGLVADLQDSLALPSLDEDGRGLVSSVRRELRACLADFLVRIDAKDAQRVETLGLKVQIVRKWLLLCPSVRAIASPTVRDRHQRTLNAIAADLRKPVPQNDLKVTLDTDNRTLDGLPEAIRTDINQDLKDRATALRNDLDAAIGKLPAVRLRTQLETIRVSIPASGDVSFEALTRAQKDFVLAMVDDLRGRLDQPPPPYIIDKDAWAAAVATVRDLLVPASAMEPAPAREAYRIAYAALLRRLSDAEQLFLDRLVNEAHKRNLDDKTLDPLSQRFNAMIAKLQSGELEEADSLIAALGSDLLTASSKGAQMGGGLPTSPSPTPPTVPAVPAFSLLSRFHAPTLAPIERITARRVHRAPTIELTVNAVVLGVAVLLGLKVLYFDDLTWGGWSGYITAALWGLGMHQFTYAGAGGLADRFLGKGAGATTP